MPAKRPPLRCLVLLLLLAAAVRLPTLTWRSLDGDEGASLYFSSFPYKELFIHLADLSIERHPLLYCIPLKAWRQIAGDADVALRLPSALAGILTVALVYQLGRRRLGEATAGLAALLFALNPLIIYQHQDARNYALALLFVVLAAGALWEALDGPRARVGLHLGVFFVALTLAAYTHLIAATLYPALGTLLIWELRRARRVALWAMGALVASAALYLPYIVNILRTDNVGSGVVTLAQGYTTLLSAAGSLLAFRTPLDHPAFHGILLGVLGLIVALGAWRGRREGAMLALWFMVVLPLTIFIMLRIGFYQSKTFVFAALPLSLLMGLACWGKSSLSQVPNLREARALPALALLGLMAYALAFQWRVGAQREDFCNAARTVRAQATAHDTVVMHLTWYRFVFGHYYPAPFVHPFANNVDASTSVEEGLRPYLDSEVLWLVQAGVGLPGSSGDPGRVVQRWMAERYPVVTEVFPSGVDVRGYATRYRFASLPDSATPLKVAYPGGLALLGCRLPQRDLPARDRWLHPPSTWVPVTLYWSATQPLEGDVRMTLALEDERGTVWGRELARPSDLRAFYPPAKWQPGEVVRWDFDVNTNPQVLPGEYKVVLRVHQAEGGATLVHAGGNDWVILDRVRLR